MRVTGHFDTGHLDTSVFSVNSFTSLAKQRRICTQNILLFCILEVGLRMKNIISLKNVFVAQAQTTLEVNTIFVHLCCLSVYQNNFLLK